eukprot:SAG11_NODE_9118_length_941_cov_0.916865_1_plen_252_part_01
MFFVRQDIRLGNDAARVVLVVGPKQDLQAFATQDHVEVLVQLHNIRAVANPGAYTTHRFEASKVTRAGRLRPVVLEFLACQLRQIDPASGKVLSCYNFKNIRAVEHLKPSLESQNEGCFTVICGGTTKHQRAHIFASPQWKQIADCIVSEMKLKLGIEVQLTESEHPAEEVLQQRQEVTYADETSGVRQFEVYKKTSRYEAPTPRVLMLSRGRMAEVDARSRALISVRSMEDVFAIVRNQVGLQPYHACDPF